MAAPESPDYSSYLHVAAAAVRNARGEILIARRHDHLHQGGLWEFPGGKVEPGESAEVALSRELQEEVGIITRSVQPLIQVPYAYPDRRVLLDVFAVDSFSGEAHGREGQPIAWVVPERLREYDFPAANRPIVTAARLPDACLVTPEPGLKEQWHSFLKQLSVCLEQGVRLVQLRAKTLEEAAYLELAGEVRIACREHGALLLLNAPPQWVERTGADGVHLPTSRLMALQGRPLPSGHWVSAACHGPEELARAEAIDADFVLASPVLPTASHPGAAVLGWEGFRGLTSRAGVPVYALGGMSPERIPAVRAHGGQGIAAIRALWERVG